MVSQMVQPLNIRTIKSAVQGARQYVQDEKIQISRRTITKFQYGDRWPDKYNSFVTSETRRNRYKDPDKFFAVMHSKPQWYARKFIFRPIDDYASKLIRQATIDAYNLIIRKAQAYGTITGHYSASFQIRLDGALLSNITQLDVLNNDSVTQILNTAEYAGTSEKNALYFSGIGGIIYYAANMIKRNYPQLGVRYVYNRSATVGVRHKYDVPVLTIGSRENVIDKIKKPGRNHRRRDRIRRSR